MYDEYDNIKYLYIKSIDNGKYGIVDINGNIIKDFNIDCYNNLYSSSQYWYSIKNDTMINYKDGKYGITKITTDDILIDYTIDEIKLESSAYFEGRTGNEWNLYYINYGAKLATLTTKKYDISENNLYVSTQEEKYNNYKRDKKVVIDKNQEYYIENNKLYFKNNNEVEVVNIGNENPKYLALGADCAGIFVTCLTNEGNVFLINRGGKNYTNEKLYDKQDAKEFLLFSESKVFTTCGELSLYVITNDDKMLFVPEIKEDNYKTRDEIHPYSLAFDTKNINIYDYDYTNNYNYKIILYSDGTINKYMYPEGMKYDFDKEFISIDGKKLLISYIFILDKDVFVIDTNGIIYEVTNANEKSNDKLLINLKQSDITNEKINYIEITSYVENQTYRYENIEITRKVKKIILYDKNGEIIKDMVN